MTERVKPLSSGSEGNSLDPSRRPKPKGHLVGDEIGYGQRVAHGRAGRKAILKSAHRQDGVAGDVKGQVSGAADRPKPVGAIGQGKTAIERVIHLRARRYIGQLNGGRVVATDDGIGHNVLETGAYHRAGSASGRFADGVNGRVGRDGHQTRPIEGFRGVVAGIDVRRDTRVFVGKWNGVAEGSSEGIGARRSMRGFFVPGCAWRAIRVGLLKTT